MIFAQRAPLVTETCCLPCERQSSLRLHMSLRHPAKAPGHCGGAWSMCEKSMHERMIRVFNGNLREFWKSGARTGSRTGPQIPYTFPPHPTHPGISEGNLDSEFSEFSLFGKAIWIQNWIQNWAPDTLNLPPPHPTHPGIPIPIHGHSV